MSLEGMEVKGPKAMALAAMSEEELRELNETVQKQFMKACSEADSVENELKESTDEFKNSYHPLPYDKKTLDFLVGVNKMMSHLDKLKMRRYGIEMQLNMIKRRLKELHS